MLQVYINYPKPHFSIHGDSSCNFIMNHQKSDQRNIKINIDTFSTEIKKFKTKKYRFAAKSALNDMWMIIDFDDIAFEKSVVILIHHILSEHYSPFKDCPIDNHC